MTVEEYDAQIRAIEAVEEYYKNERDDALKKIVTGEGNSLEHAERFIHSAKAVEILEEEIKRLGSNKVHFMLYGEERK